MMPPTPLVACPLGHFLPGRRAFTLVELLVVVAIIAILASLLLPSLQNAQAKAHQATCAANLKQIMLATLMYADENGDRLPTACLDPSGGGSRVTSFTWDDLIAPYLGDTHMLRCPRDPMPERSGPSECLLPVSHGRPCPGTTG